MKIILIFLLTIMFSYNAISQDFSGRTVIGKQYAMEETRKALENKNTKPFYDTLIKDKKTQLL